MVVYSASEEVVGVESNKQAVVNAKENAAMNKIKNIRFIEGNASNVLPYLVKDHFIPDVMVFDPPRTGMTPDIKEAINKCLPKRIVYVSCNPASLAKDLAELTQKYQVKSNVQMEFFYSHQPYLMNEEEYQSYIETMRIPLPTTFRLTKNEQTPIIKEEKLTFY